MCDHTTHTDTYTHSNAHTHRCSACRVLCTPPNHPTSPLYTHTRTPSSLLPGGHISTCSPSDRRNFTSFGSSRSTLSMHSPPRLPPLTLLPYHLHLHTILIFPLPILHRLPAHCGTVAMQHLISL